MTIARRALATFDELAHLEQPTAIALFARLGGYATLLNDWLNTLEINLG